MSEEQFAGPMRVDIVENSKSGKSWRVNLGGKWYGAYKDSGILEALQKNIFVIFTDLGQKGGPWIMKWKLADATTAIAAPAAAPQAPQKGFTPNVIPWWSALMSNTIAHCIQAGLIKTPKDIGPWAKATVDTAMALAAGEETQEEDVPY